MLRIHRAVAVAAALSLAGCATPFKPELYNREANTHIRAIAMVSPAPQEEHGFAILHHPAIAVAAVGGLIGGLIAAGIIAAEITPKKNSMNAALKESGLEVNAEMATALKAEFAGRNEIKLEEVAASERDPKSRFQVAYKGLPTTADAYLDVAVATGYIAASHTTPYRPVMNVRVQLVDRASEAILYSQLIHHGPGTPPVGAIKLADEADAEFPNHEALIADPQKTAAPLRALIRRAAAQIASDLAPQKP